MKNSLWIQITLLVLLLSPFAWSGRLSDFEKSTSSSPSSSHDDNDDDLSFFVWLIEALFSNDDPYYSSSTTTYTPPTPTPVKVSTSSSETRDVTLRGWEVHTRLALGSWGDGFSGKSFEATWARNLWVLGFDGTWDEELLETRDTAFMRTKRVRAGIQLGEHLPFLQALAGFSVLDGERTQVFLSTRLAIENRRKYHGFRLQWDHDFSPERQGFHDIYGGAMLKASAIQLDAGYRVRFTSTMDQQAIHGPQLGVTFRFGEWR